MKHASRPDSGEVGSVDGIIGNAGRAGRHNDSIRDQSGRAPPAEKQRFDLTAAIVGDCGGAKSNHKKSRLGPDQLSEGNYAPFTGRSRSIAAGGP